MASIEQMGRVQTVLNVDGGGSPRSSRDLESDLQGAVDSQPVIPSTEKSVGATYSGPYGNLIFHSEGGSGISSGEVQTVKPTKAENENNSSRGVNLDILQNTDTLGY